VITSVWRGHMFRTKTGELSVWVEELFFLSKALLPAAGEMARTGGQSSCDTGMRYLDLIADGEVAGIFETRGAHRSGVAEVF